MILKRSYILLLLAACLCMPAGAVTKKSTTSSQPKQKGLIERISEGYDDFVEIDIPANYLNQLVKSVVTKATTAPKKEVQKTVKPGVNKVEGFRIQVFGDGSNQGSLEARARARGNAIVAKFPKYRGQVYAFSSSPNWYTRVGNFMDQKEASAALAELKRAFPQYASDMRVVKATITVIK